MRKVLGAPIKSIIILLSRNFAALILVAFLIILPIAYVMMRSFLEDYHYRIDLNPLIFILSGALIFFLSMLLVGTLAGKAAQCNPVDALKNE